MKKYLMMLFVALAAVLQSCNNNDDLWSAIDDLKGRVQALETQVKALNGNIEALQKLYNGATITNVTRQGDKYILELSNGEVIELEMGSKAEAVIPVMSISADGYWQVSYDGGKTFESLGVKAEAADGQTPQFRIDEATGYWQVSYDGATYNNVLDTAGNPVTAVGGGTVTDKFFADVKVDGDLFVIEMLDGTKIEVPILKDFFCRIKVPAEGVQKFTLGETKRFVVEIKGVDDTSLNAPEGWTVSLTEAVSERAELIVTAPATVFSSRAAADNSKDVSILALSNSYACIAKIQVEAEAAVDAPTAVVTNSATTLPTTSSLTFDVTTTHADGWKYICQKSSDAAPGVSKILADGTAGAGASVTVDNLIAATKYTFYVVAYKDALNSGVQNVENTTEAPAAIDYYEAGVTIGGVTYSKNTPGVTLLTDAASITAAGVYFLDPQAENTVYTLPKLAAAEVVIIGRHEGAQPKLTISGIQSLNGASGVGYIFKNLDVTGATGNYVFNFGGTVGIYDNLMIEDCRFVQSFSDASFTYFNNANSAIRKFTVRNSRIGMTVSADAKAIRVVNYNATKVAEVQSLSFENSIIYTLGDFVANGTLIFLPTSGASTDWIDVSVQNSTVVNFIGQPNGFINLSGDKSLTMTRNIFWARDGYKATWYMLKFAVTTTAPPMSITDNIFYGLNSDTSWAVYHTGSSYKTTDTYTRETVDPFDGGEFSTSTGVFVSGPAYADYGAKIK